MTFKEKRDSAGKGERKIHIYISEDDKHLPTLTFHVKLSLVSE